MKRTLFALLALAACLSACAPAAPETPEEAPVTATTETTPEETLAGSCTVVGTLRSLNDSHNPADGFYQVETLMQPDGSYHGILTKLDFASARQISVCDVGPIEQLGGYFAWGGGFCYLTWPSETEAMLHIRAQGEASERTVILDTELYPVYVDDRYLYLCRYDPFASFGRVDLTTGAVEKIQIPDSVSMICDTDGKRLLINRLISEVALEPLWNDGEQYDAALQNATLQYAWWDPATGTVETVLEEPCKGSKDEDGRTFTRIYIGKNEDSLFFYISEAGGIQRRVERCALDGSGNEVFIDLPESAGAPGAVDRDGNIRWLVFSEEQGILFYDAVTGQQQTVTDAAGTEVPWPMLETQDGRVLVSIATQEIESGFRYRLIPEDDYLAGNFTGTDVTPLEE